MQRGYNLLLVSFIIFSQSCAQKAPAPDYLTKQDFPDSAKNMTMITMVGDNITFSEVLALHRGKKVVIDFWASWCRDCISGLPQLQELKQKSAQANVVFVCISLDKDENRWRSAIDRFSIKGDHYRIEPGWKNALSNYVGLDWIPRFMVLNENGKVILPKAVVADDGELHKTVLE
jgi:thiol-disulfide isomerase/thioredoxin